MTKRELLSVLKTLLAALLAEDPPKPKAPPAPPPPAGTFTMRQGMYSGKLEILGPDGQWQRASFVPRGYTRDEDGWWRSIDLRRR